MFIKLVKLWLFFSLFMVIASVYNYFDPNMRESFIVTLPTTISYFITVILLSVFFLIRYLKSKLVNSKNLF